MILRHILPREAMERGRVMVQDRLLLRIHVERGLLDNREAPLNATRQAEGCVGLEVRRVAPHGVPRRTDPVLCGKRRDG